MGAPGDGLGMSSWAKGLAMMIRKIPLWRRRCTCRRPSCRIRTSICMNWINRRPRGRITSPGIRSRIHEMGLLQPCPLSLIRSDLSNNKRLASVQDPGRYLVRRQARSVATSFSTPIDSRISKMLLFHQRLVNIYSQHSCAEFRIREFGDRRDLQTRVRY